MINRCKIIDKNNFVSYKFAFKPFMKTSKLVWQNLLMILRDFGFLVRKSFILWLLTNELVDWLWSFRANRAYLDILMCFCLSHDTQQHQHLQKKTNNEKPLWHWIEYVKWFWLIIDYRRLSDVLFILFFSLARSLLGMFWIVFYFPFNTDSYYMSRIVAAQRPF